MKSLNELTRAAAHLAAHTYDSARLKKEVDSEVSRLVADGEPLDEDSTYDRALDAVADRYHMDGLHLSREAHRADWRKGRKGNLMQYVRAILDEQESPALPGFEQMMKLPRQLLLDNDDVVDLGDGRLTLALVMEQLRRAEGISKKEASACSDRAKVLWDEQAQFLALIEVYKKVAAEAARRFGVGPEDLIYDRKEKGWKPRKDTSSRS